MNRRTITLMLPLVFAAAAAAAQEDLLDIFRPRMQALWAEESSSPQAVDPTDTAATEMPAAPFRAPSAPPPSTEEVLPGPGERVQVPLANVGTPGEVKYGEHGDHISLVVRDASLSYVLALLAERRGLNIVAANDIDSLVSITLYNKTVEEALTAILSVASYTWTSHNGIIYVTSLSQSAALPELQGRRIDVFHLDYVSAQDMKLAVDHFLSPVGESFVSESDPQDNRRTQETLIVEDVPYALERIAAFIHQMDQAPRQVLIEAHVLQVELKDDRRHGVDFQRVFDVMGNDVAMTSLLGANPALADIQLGRDIKSSFFATVSGGSLTALVELLKTTTDAKTLASPRLLVINEQKARLQVGEKIGYQQPTVTETSTVAGAAFVEVGVILEITPRITRDNRVLLEVRPKVSDGQVNPATGVPDEETTELETNVLLGDGYGVVIGGMIREADSVVQNKIPYLGDVYLLGKLFQSEEVKKSRSEIIVVLIPRIYPYAPTYTAYEQGNVTRAETGLLEGPLLRKDRPWEAKLPDALSNPRQLRVPPVGKTYPYPAAHVERAATPQRQLPVPARPMVRGDYPPNGIPTHVQYGDGIHYQQGRLHQQEAPPDAPVRFATDEADVPSRTGRR